MRCMLPSIIVFAMKTVYQIIFSVALLLSVSPVFAENEEQMDEQEQTQAESIQIHLEQILETTVRRLTFSYDSCGNRIRQTYTERTMPILDPILDPLPGSEIEPLIQEDGGGE